jgi:cytochrome P450
MCTTTSPSLIDTHPLPPSHTPEAVVTDAAPSDPSAADSAAAAGSSSCPFLAQLPRPPPSAAPWWTLPLSIVNPPAHQEMTIAGRAVVEGSFLLRPAVLPCTGELAREVLTAEGDKTTVGWPPHFRSLFGDESLILATEKRHRFLRSLMQPAFTAEGISGFV